MASPNVQVIIVGAGLSGLRAAKELQDAGISYLVLEAMDRVGGRTLSMPTKENGQAPVDLGAAWINDTAQTEMHSMVQTFGLTIEEQRHEGTSVYQDHLGKLTSMPYGMETGIMEHVDRWGPENPTLSSEAITLDSMTAMEFIENEFNGSEVAYFLIATMCHAILGSEPNEMSALQLVDYLKSAGGLPSALSDTKGGAQHLRIQQGCQSFAKGLAAQLDPERIRLLSPVCLISQNDQGCVVEAKDGTSYRAVKVIMTIPTPLYRTVTFQPELPRAKAVLSESTKFGYYAKTILIFPSPWWRNAGLSGCLDSETGPISLARDTASPEEGQYSITCFHVADAGRAWSKLTASERREAVLEQYRTMFSAVVKDVPEPTQIFEKEWAKDTLAPGAGVPVMMPGVLTGDAGRAMRDPVGHIHFIGTETALVFKGFMEGAVRSGIRGGQEVIAALKST
ncbi:flavin monoamine oxidase family protein [Aspergillus undulatus]|uniref:flavin monoamine oxidase family protein n=1 Tax=Aspergillus undulatus TaxID=1810928 RepID=UPI003CCDAAD7